MGTRQKEKSEQTRKELQDAMIKLFLENGYDETSVRDISDLAGYSVGSFYRQWKSKQQAFMEYWDSYVSDFIQESVKKAPETTDAREMVRYLIQRSDFFSAQEITKKLYITSRILSTIYAYDRVADWAVAYNQMIYQFLARITASSDQQKLTSTTNIIHTLLNTHAMQYAAVTNPYYDIDNQTLEECLFSIVANVK